MSESVKDLWSIAPEQLNVCHELRDLFHPDCDIIATTSDIFSSETIFESIDGSLDILDDTSSNDYFSSSLQQWTELQKCVSDVSGRLKDAVSNVGRLSELYDQVSTRTSSLHDACEQLMNDQTQFASAADELNSTLQNFLEVDRITQRLTSTQFNVASSSFSQLLNHIDQAIKFLNSHPSYKEVELYLTKYQACLARALSMVRTFVKQQLTLALQNVQSKAGDKSQDAFTLYYGLFGTQSSAVKAVMEDLASRIGRCVEYENAFTECQQMFFDMRTQLMLPVAHNNIMQLTNSSAVKDGRPNSFRNNQGPSLCAVVRKALSMLLRLSQDESSLHHRFFGDIAIDSAVLADFIERVCYPMYDIARPLLLGTPHLQALAELCSILQAELNEDTHGLRGAALEGFERVLMLLLADTRERLVYRAQIYARSDISGYQPAAGDLAYPEKLQMMKQISDEQQSKVDHREGDSEVSTVICAADVHGLWYPPVRRCILCLTKLFGSVEPNVFNGVSQDVIAQCIEALEKATSQLKQQKSALHAELFMLKHLLILREQTAPFRTAHQPLRETSLDFGRFKDAAYGLLAQRSRIFSLSNNSLLEFMLQTPHQMSSQQMIESGRLLDVALRAACQTFIGDTAPAFLLAELQTVATKISNVESAAKEESGIKLASQPWATCESMRNSCASAYRQLKENWPKLLDMLQLYISSADTEGVLLQHISKRVKTTFGQLKDSIARNYTPEQQQIIACPAPHQINLLMATSYRPPVKKSSLSGSVTSLSSAEPVSQRINLPEPDVVVLASNGTDLVHNGSAENGN